MTPTEAVKLVQALRDNWDTPTWSQGRFDLFVDALLPVPLELAQAAVRKLILRGLPRAEFRVRVEHVTAEIDRLAERQRVAAEQRLDRLAIAGPKDPEVGRLLRATIVRLEARRRTAGGQLRSGSSPPANSHRGRLRANGSGRGAGSPRAANATESPATRHRAM